MMYNQPQQSVIPPALQALLVLKQSMSPTTPNGAPTVAAGIAQQAQQSMAPPQAPMQPQDGQGIMGALGRMGDANPSMQRNAQEAQMNGIAAKAAQMIQSKPQGITGLDGASQQTFAEGGIVNFAEGGRTLGSAPPKIMDAMKYADLSIYDSPEVRAQKIARGKARAEFEKQPVPIIPGNPGSQEWQQANVERGYQDQRRPPNMAGNNIASAGIAALLAPPTKGGSSSVSASTKSKSILNPPIGFDIDSIMKTVMGSNTGASEVDLKEIGRAHV